MNIPLSATKAHTKTNANSVSLTWTSFVHPGFHYMLITYQDCRRIPGLGLGFLCGVRQFLDSTGHITGRFLFLRTALSEEAEAGSRRSRGGNHADNGRTLHPSS